MTGLTLGVESWAQGYAGGRPIQLKPLSSIDGRFSRVQRFRLRAGAHVEVLYAKTFVPIDSSPDERARQLRYLTAESERLRAAGAAFERTPWLRVPRLLVSDPEHLTIITAEVDGKPLSSLLTRCAALRARSTLRRATDAVGRAGEWLRRFQDHVPIRDESAYSKDYRAYLEDRLRILVHGAGGAFTDRDRIAALNLFERHHASLAPEEWWPKPAHGDFCPANIFVTDAAVSVIDLAMSTDRARYLDLTHLYFHLSLVARRLLLGRRMRAELQQALLAGFGPGASAASPLFRAMLLQHAVCYLVQFVPTAQWTALDRRRFRRRAAWALRLAGLEV
jgi:tRNA A-37 threonylcarbamoyl transferase component Bud32